MPISLGRSDLQPLLPHNWIAVDAEPKGMVWRKKK